MSSTTAPTTPKPGSRYVFRHLHGPRSGDGERVTVTDHTWTPGDVTFYGIVRESGTEGLALAVELTLIGVDQ